MLVIRPPPPGSAAPPGLVALGPPGTAAALHAAAAAAAVGGGLRPAPTAALTGAMHSSMVSLPTVTTTCAKVRRGSHPLQTVFCEHRKLSSRTIDHDSKVQVVPYEYVCYSVLAFHSCIIRAEPRTHVLKSCSLLKIRVQVQIRSCHAFWRAFQRRPIDHILFLQHVTTIDTSLNGTRAHPSLIYESLRPQLHTCICIAAGNIFI